MCGIAGIWAGGPLTNGTPAQFAVRMEQAIRHRGPDGSGVWSDDEIGIALSHRRLAIIDLSEAGAQPMTSRSGRYVISYNGEIYNFRELRKTLVASGWPDQWRGTSDTEVLLAAIEFWGLEDTLPRLDGMFAIALWDRHERRLRLARDRFGEKPLYYGFAGRSLLFGSELAALAAGTPDGLGALDPRAIHELTHSFCIPAPLSIYRNIAKLPPATSITIGLEDVRARTLPLPRPYWSARDTALTAATTPFTGSPEEANAHLLDLLESSIRLRMVADVPVGAMLSSGIDSSVICALAQHATSTPLRTFTVGTDDPAFDETSSAASIARALGTEHTTIHIGADEALHAVPDMAQTYDEPFADSSQILTTLLARALRREVTVALSGDGGDELFGGYVRYVSAPKLWGRLSALPLPVRQAVAGVVRGLGQERLAASFARLTGVRGEGAGRINKALGLLDSVGEADLYARLLDVWPSRMRGTGNVAPLPHMDAMSFARRMMLADTVGYLPSDVLVKVDRAAMATALETRVPFLSPDLFAFAWSLPDGFLIKGNKGKQPLRRVAERYIPPALLDRPKGGFAAPIGTWLRGPLRDWAEDLLCDEQVSGHGVLDATIIQKSWSRHIAGKSDESARLWPILMFEAWRRAQTGISPARTADIELAPLSPA